MPLTPQIDSSRETSSATTKMGVYKLTFPGETSPTTAKSTPFHHSNMGRRFIPGYTTARVQPMAKSSSLESPELEHFTTVAMSMATDTISEDDATSVFTASTRTSNTISDDDISLADFAVRSTSANFARHSTACCTDLALRRELRKKFHVEPALDEAPSTFSDSFAMGHSFRRELEKEDRVDSLALWEETVMPASTSSRDRTISKDMPHSWHAHTAPSMSSRNKGLESIFRKPKKASSSFFNALFSGLTFSSSRRSRKPR